MLSRLPLSYCTNVHPAQTVAEVCDGLTKYSGPVRQAFGEPLAAGLWLAAPVVSELLATAGERRLGETLRGLGLSCHTLNAFPFGNFHSDRVKESVYVPDWSTELRRTYTRDCARVLAALLPDGVDGSLSTVPLGFKQLPHAPDFAAACADKLLDLVGDLAHIERETGRLIRLAIEPEPLCVLETTAETIQFFETLFELAPARGLADEAARHVGVCYDICHQAVEFEDVAASVRQFDLAGVRINKVHITCAIELDRPGENAAGRAALARYVEPRYLHQTFAKLPDGRVLSQTDLTDELCAAPPHSFAEASAWRVHFHVPVDAESLGPLGTTRREIRAALAAVRELSYAPHLEVETYTWPVLPEGAPAVGTLVAGLTRELAATRSLITEIDR